MSETMNRRRWLTGGVCLAAGAGLGWVGAQMRWANPAVAAETEDGHEARRKKLGRDLPRVARPSGATLVPTVRVGDTLYVSGHIPSVDGKPILGKLGKDMKVDEGKKAARQVGLIILSVVRAELGSLDKVV